MPIEPAFLASIEAVLDTVRPALKADGGDVAVVDFDEASGLLQVRFSGACAHCAMSNLTLRIGIGRALKEKLPQIKEVEAVRE